MLLFYASRAKKVLRDYSENAIDTTKTIYFDHPGVEGIVIDYMKDFIFLVSGIRAELYITKFRDKVI